MKNLLLILFVVLSTSVFSKSFDKDSTLKEKAVLDNFIIGVDNKESICRKIDTPEYNIYSVAGSDGIFDKITYRLPNLVRIDILLINDTLYSVKYYPLSFNEELNELKEFWLIGDVKKYNKLNSKIQHRTKIKDKLVLKYKKYLNTEYNAYDTNSHWFNSYIDVNFDTDNDGDFFIHYDSLKPKYLQYNEKI